MFKAIWNGQVIAESDRTVLVEGNHYFPIESIAADYFRSSSSHTFCPWKGQANYFDLNVDGQVNRDGAWYYDEPSNAARVIKGHTAFWKGVEVVQEDGNRQPPGS